LWQLATAPPLCLDPDVKVGLAANVLNYNKCKYNLTRTAKKRLLASTEPLGGKDALPKKGGIRYGFYWLIGLLAIFKWFLIIIIIIFGAQLCVDGFLEQEELSATAERVRIGHVAHQQETPQGRGQDQKRFPSAFLQ
jgi:hypothetical protein